MRDARVETETIETIEQRLQRALESAAADRQRLRELAARAFRAQEEERRRIAAELQEGTAQALAALLIRLRIARNTTDPASRDALLDAIRDDLAGALEGVRSFARTLRPPALDELGLAAAVAAYARRLSESYNLPIECACEGPAGGFPPQVELALYRIVQEALSNVVRHAGASHARVRIGCAGDVVEVIVEDNGRGFDVADVLAVEPALGLFGMHDRAAAVGGTVEIRSRAGEGTRVVARVPFGEAAAPRAPWPTILPPDAA